MIRTRPFAPGDRAACLAIFDGNVPRFFAPAERVEFTAFLDRHAGTADHPYLVLTEAEAVVACSGLSVEGDGRVSLSWGMVARHRHGEGLGRLLTATRIAAAREMAGVTAITLATSQHTRGFYERLGFAVESVRPDGFGRGLDRWDMTLFTAEGRFTGQG